MEAARALDRTVLVLNKRWDPIQVASMKEGISLVAKGAALILEPGTYERHDLLSWDAVSKAKIKFGDAVIRSPRLVLLPPEVIVLTNYEGLGERSVVFSRKNLFKRDRYTCFASGTPVQMADGSWKPIEDIQVGDSVICASGSSAAVLQKRVQISDKRHLLVKAYYGLPVTCTEDHRFLTYDGEKAVWVEARNLEKKHILRPVRSGSISLDKTMARIVGYYTAEGCTTGKNGADFYVRFTIAPEEEEIASDLKSLVAERFGKHLTDKTITDKRTGWHYRVLGVSSVDVSRTISQYVRGKQPERHFTFDPALLDEESAKALLDAMMKGDGCTVMMRDSRCFIYVTSSKTLALQVQGLAFRLGYFASIVEGIQSGSFGEGNRIYHVRWFPDAKRVLGKKVLVNGVEYISVPIQYVKPVEYDGPVWDIEVKAEAEIGHSFVVPSGIAHNCQYCGIQPGPEELTVDHVLPRSRGGISSWENCLLACVECNKRKANRTPAEADMKPRKEAKKPTWRMLAQVQPRQRKESWEAFLGRAYWEVELEP